MKRDQLAFLLGGLLLGVVLGYGIFHATARQPVFAPPPGGAAIEGPRGPAAMTQVPMGAPPAGAVGGGAPMVAEINALKKTLQEDPKNLPAAVRLAHLHHDAGMFEQAIAFYARALEISPNQPDYLTDKGICHERLQQFDEALSLFHKAQATDPNHWQSLYNTVVVAGFHLKRIDEADEALARLEKVNPGAPNLASLKETLEQVKQGATP